jgi:nucleoside-diphosphate-sugar epimerase
VSLDGLRGKTVFVTGGTGFVGGRLVEVLVEQLGARARLATRGACAGRGAFRAASLGAELFEGSITDRVAMAEATKDCSAVFHCAYGSYGSERDQRDVTVSGTRVLAEAAARNGVKRFVNLSTLVTCGPNTPAVVDEGFVNSQMWAWPYAVDKRDAEVELATVAERGELAAVNLRLGPVYGPWGPAFTISPLKTLAVNRMALVGDGDGLSNVVYVDDVVQAMLRAAVVPHTGFETYLITGPDDVTWRRFYSAYCDMLGVDRLVSLSSDEHRRAGRGGGLAQLLKVIPAAGRALARDPEFRRVASRLPLSRSVYGMMKRSRVAGAGTQKAPLMVANEPLELVTLPPMMLDYFACRTRFLHQKAVERLGYQPRYDLASGMALVRAWAEWARLL